MKFCLLLILVFVFTLPAFAQPMIEDDSPKFPPLSQFIERTTRIFGKVLAVGDGETATVIDLDGKRRKIRLSGIDAPKHKRGFGQRSRQHLADLILGLEIVADIGEADKKGYSTGKVYVNGIEANLEQIKSGCARYYRMYQNELTLKDRLAYSDAEREAKSARRGLWSRTAGVK